MTNTRILIAAAMAILGLWFFIKPAAPKRSLATSAPIHEAQPQLKKPSKSAVAQLEQSVAAKPVSESEQESKCWEAVENANPPTSGYINVARKDLDAPNAAPP